MNLAFNFNFATTMGDRCSCEFHIKIGLPEPVISINHIMNFFTTQKVDLASKYVGGISAHTVI